MTPDAIRAERARRRREGMRRGAAILPSLFTLGNLFLGFWAIILTLEGNYGAAAPLILWAGVLDMLDGRIARMTGTTSEFGAELDSLADVVSFGMAPAVMVYAWAIAPLGRVGWLTAFLFLLCGTLRLARFNVQRNVTDSRYFVGLPIPAAAAPIATLVQCFPEGNTEPKLAILVGSLVVALAFLMVSTFRYSSMKKIDLRTRRSYLVLLAIMLAFILIAFHPRWMLLAMATLYWTSGPASHLVSLVNRRRASKSVEPAAVV